MKKNNIKILTAVLVISIIIGAGVYAYTNNANEISFTPKNSDWKVENVSDALEDLYNGNNCRSGVVHLNRGNSSLTIDTGINYRMFYINVYLENDFYSSWSYDSSIRKVSQNYKFGENGVINYVDKTDYFTLTSTTITSRFLTGWGEYVYDGDYSWIACK